MQIKKEKMRIFVSHLQNARKNDTNTANKPFCVDMLKGWKKEKESYN
jgi:hypothetical protein